MEQIYELGIIKKEQIDIELSKRLEEVYDIDIICSSLTQVRTPSEKLQGRFSILVDSKKSKNDIIKSLRYLKGVNNYGAIISLPEYGDDFKMFAEIVATEYLDILGLKRGNFDEIYVTVFEFSMKAINYIYSKSYQEIRNTMLGKIIVDQRDIIGVEDSKYYFLIDNLEDFEYAIYHKKMIYASIYEIMKKYDYYACFNYEDLKISFFLKDSLDSDILNNFLQRRPIC